MLTDYLGAFFNGVFLIALALSILFQSIEHFITVEDIDQPLLVIRWLDILSAGVAHGESHYYTLSELTVQTSVLLLLAS